MSKGVFISFEGGEGAGKSTQITLLGEKLKSAGHDVVVTREPGGSKGAEDIRALLVSGEGDRWSALTEALLVYAARNDHLEKTVRPALAKGAVVLSDRFADSSMAYQGVAGALGREVVEGLDAMVVAEDTPDLTLVFDLPPNEGLARAGARGGDARFEGKGLDFHGKVRAAFRAIADAAPERCTVIDAAQSVEEVHKSVCAAVGERLNLLK
ncbi:MAG: dTMP kinase [Pseudomonadota bacterium]